MTPTGVRCRVWIRLPSLSEPSFSVPPPIQRGRMIGTTTEAITGATDEAMIGVIVATITAAIGGTGSRMGCAGLAPA